MTFETWWREQCNSYWGLPVFAARDAWNASEKATREFKQRVLDALNKENCLELDAYRLRQELHLELTGSPETQGKTCRLRPEPNDGR